MKVTMSIDFERRTGNGFHAAVCPLGIAEFASGS